MFAGVLDTGSQFTAISERLFKIINVGDKYRVVSPTRATGGGGAPIRTKQTVELPVLVNAQTFRVLRFQVVPHLPVDAIIGTDILEQGARVDFKLQRLFTSRSR